MKWISILEEKPPYDENILLYEDGCVTVGVLGEYGGKEIWEPYGRCCCGCWTPENVTHWAYFPEGPK